MDEPVYTPREAILHSATLLKKTISVQGTVALVDQGLGRVDISHGGAKLIVRLFDDQNANANPAFKMPQTNDIVIVTGTLRKEMRRTFLMATKLQIL